MTPYQNLIADSHTFARIARPLFQKYYAGDKLIRYDQRHSSIKHDILIDTKDDDNINYSIRGTNYNQTFAVININKDSFNNENLIHIIIRLRYGQQRRDAIKTFYSKYTMVYKIGVGIIDKRGHVISARLMKTATKCGQTALRIFLKYVNNIK